MKDLNSLGFDFSRVISCRSPLSKSADAIPPQSRSVEMFFVSNVDVYLWFVRLTSTKVTQILVSFSTQLITLSTSFSLLIRFPCTNSRNCLTRAIPFWRAYYYPLFLRISHQFNSSGTTSVKRFFTCDLWFRFASISSFSLKFFLCESILMDTSLFARLQSINFNHKVIQISFSIASHPSGL